VIAKVRDTEGLMVMSVEDAAEQQLKQMMGEAKIDFLEPRGLEVYEVFRQFANLPFECSSESLLFECGTFESNDSTEALYKLRLSEYFLFGLKRIWDLEIEDKEDRSTFLYSEVVTCQLLFEATDELKELRISIHSDNRSSNSDGRVYDNFFIQIESRAEFQIPITKFVPRKLVIH
jgi:hypothetical protein